MHCLATSNISLIRPTNHIHTVHSLQTMENLLLVTNYLYMWLFNWITIMLKHQNQGLHPRNLDSGWEKTVISLTYIWIVPWGWSQQRVVIWSSRVGHTRVEHHTGRRRGWCARVDCWERQARPKQEHLLTLLQQSSHLGMPLHVVGIHRRHAGLRHRDLHHLRSNAGGLIHWIWRHGTATSW